jgi:two-component system phosphate regulon sensor histidine kinase PhoR
MVLYQQLEENMNKELKNEMALTSLGYNQEGIQYLESIKGIDGYLRMTLVNNQGIALFDNRADIATMENHLDRPEIIQAFRDGDGQSTRISGTLDTQLFYMAKLMDDGNVLRLSTITDSIGATLSERIPEMVAILLLIILLAIFFGRMQTRKIVKPINEINLEDPHDNCPYDEIAPLITKIRKLNDSGRKQMEELAERSKNFSEITIHMKEGLMIIDENGKIISLNKSGLVFFDIADFDYEGKHYTNINRSTPLRNAVETALSGNFWTETIVKGGQSFLIQSTPVIRNEVTTGAIVMIFDVTEQHKAELVRKEFTANVSHELKTPLTTILGYAELIKNRMAQGEDTVNFAGKIYTEATELIDLIEDIIKLSELDEKHNNIGMEEIDLFAAANSVISRLQSIADKKEVSLHLEGSGGLIKGVPSMIDELLVNLCDNAIKYNKISGDVKLSVDKIGENIQLKIVDTGIGIPIEHQDRVFERFYRVDKSHSKETRGTGLGLSIVKHIVAYHKASIMLESSIDTGTSITIIFPQIA